MFFRLILEKRTLVKGVGLPLVFANWLMAGWAIAWVGSFVNHKYFLISDAPIALPSIPPFHNSPCHTPSFADLCQHCVDRLSSAHWGKVCPIWFSLIFMKLIFFIHRPLDTILIHAPVRAFMILPLGVLVPYSLFVTLGWTWSPGEPQHYARHQWAGLGIMLGVNLLGELIFPLPVCYFRTCTPSRSYRGRSQARHHLVRRSKLDRCKYMGT